MEKKNVRSFMPKSTIKVHKGNLKLFFYWVYERQNIWYNRFFLKKNAPWTEDEILRIYKFTNVYRELDYNSQWLIRNVIQNTKNKMNMLWKILVFRYFNKPELFEFMGGVPSYEKYNAEVFENYVLKFREKYGRPFTNAYLINPPKKQSEKKLGIDRFYCFHIERLHTNMVELWMVYKKSKEPKQLIKWFIKNMKCVSNFMAYEFYCDLCYTHWFKFGENDFVNVGPGAKAGIELIFPITRIRKNWVSKLEFLQRNADYYLKKFGFEDFKYYNGKKLTLRCIEHSLCEFFKYWKQIHKVGKQRIEFKERKNSFKF